MKPIDNKIKQNKARYNLTRQTQIFQHYHQEMLAASMKI